MLKVRRLTTAAWRPHSCCCLYLVCGWRDTPGASFPLTCWCVCVQLQAAAEEQGQQGLSAAAAAAELDQTPSFSFSILQNPEGASSATTDAIHAAPTSQGQAADGTSVDDSEPSAHNDGHQPAGSPAAPEQPAQAAGSTEVAAPAVEDSAEAAAGTAVDAAAVQGGEDPADLQRELAVIAAISQEDSAFEVGSTPPDCVGFCRLCCMTAPVCVAALAPAHGHGGPLPCTARQTRQGCAGSATRQHLFVCIAILAPADMRDGPLLCKSLPQIMIWPLP